MKVLIDTNRYVDFCRSAPDVSDILSRAERIAMPFVSLAELRAVFRCGTLGRRNESTLLRFLSSSRVQVLYPDERTTHSYAGLFAQLRAQGTPIPTNDLWIAALAVQHGLFLCSRDAHFDHLPQLARV
ncbi:MAG: type II toxin-antitoxin system VapC family toxin [Kiritimatiellae bacterium]|nr:type II toxin-antitoxin system VapC family toxin [Kiritimatiellia bacterium]MDD4024549.1 type II toxin-antitoxin system VapC family toxin [Kiritimatiellia bacterium]MDD4623726.1 type II toxin-antitoxin system VapC family toxin [Kiritimatiellia bacterium]